MWMRAQAGSFGGRAETGPRSLLPYKNWQETGVRIDAL